jgi:hypothetical protein
MVVPNKTPLGGVLGAERARRAVVLAAVLLWSVDTALQLAGNKAAGAVRSLQGGLLHVTATIHVLYIISVDSA